MRTWRETIDALASTADTRTLEGRMTIVEWEGVKKAMHMLSIVANNGGKPIEECSPAYVASYGLESLVRLLGHVDTRALPISTGAKNDGGSR